MRLVAYTGQQGIRHGVVRGAAGAETVVDLGSGDLLGLLEGGTVSIIGPDEPLVLPTIAAQVDWELELERRPSIQPAHGAGKIYGDHSISRGKAERIILVLSDKNSARPRAISNRKTDLEFLTGVLGTLRTPVVAVGEG